MDGKQEAAGAQQEVGPDGEIGADQSPMQEINDQQQDHPRHPRRVKMQRSDWPAENDDQRRVSAVVCRVKIFRNKNRKVLICLV